MDRPRDRRGQCVRSAARVKVLYVNPIGELGGAERSLLDLIWSLKRFDPTLEAEILSFAPGPLGAAAAELGVRCDVLPLPENLHSLGESGSLLGTVGKLVGGSSTALAFVTRLRRRLIASQAAVVHTNGLKAHVLAALARASSQKLVWHVHDFLSGRRTMRRVLPALRGRASAAIAVSDAVASDIRPLVRGLGVEVVLNGIRTEQFRRERVTPVDLDSLAQLRPGAGTRVGLIATYAHWKGHELFLDAVARAGSEGAKYYVIGGPVYGTDASQVSEAQLRQRIQTLNLERTVGLIPFQRAMAPVYAALDVVVHASTRPEPFGRTVAEALASECAVVAAGAGGVTEQLTHLQEGILFEPGSVQELAGAVRLLLDDASLRRRLAAAGRERAGRTLDAGRLGERTASIYRAVLKTEQRG